MRLLDAFAALEADEAAEHDVATELLRRVGAELVDGLVGLEHAGLVEETDLLRPLGQLALDDLRMRSRRRSLGVLRELRLALAGGAAGLPLIFFLLVATLFPFAVGPDTNLLARAGGGALWTAALLAALLPVDRLVEPDRAAGVLDQLHLRGFGEEAIALAKLLGHWLSFGPPLMLAAIPAAALMKLSEELRMELEKNDKNVLSLAAIKKTEEIEKLAKRIRGRMKRF